MRKNSIAAGAALSLIVGSAAGVSARALGMNPAATGTSGDTSVSVESPEPEVEYEPYFVPFLDPLWKRIHDAPPVTDTPSLFAPYVSTTGLSNNVKSSRVTDTGLLPLVTLPVIEARVGDIVEIPVTVSYREPLTSLRLIMQVDPKVLEVMESKGVGIPTEDVYTSIEPKVPGMGDCKGCLITFTTVTTPWKKNGTMLKLRFRAIGPGEASLTPQLADVSDDKLQMIVAIARHGLIRVKP